MPLNTEPTSPRPFYTHSTQTALTKVKVRHAVMELMSDGKPRTAQDVFDELPHPRIVVTRDQRTRYSQGYSLNAIRAALNWFASTGQMKQVGKRASKGGRPHHVFMVAEHLRGAA